jgi:hypothetical protein
MLNRLFKRNAQAAADQECATTSTTAHSTPLMNANHIETTAVTPTKRKKSRGWKTSDVKVSCRCVCAHILSNQFAATTFPLCPIYVDKCV